MDATALDRTRADAVPVWDRVVRISHWTLAAAFAVAFIAEEGDVVHQAAGYVVAFVVAMRIVWGFVGSRHARFSDFVPGPRRLVAHLRDILTGRDRRSIGHNPAAGAMAVALLGLMLGLAISGWMMTTDRFFGVKWLEILHEGIANLALALVFIHVTAAIYESFRHRENLPWAMVTGRKRP